MCVIDSTPKSNQIYPKKVKRGEFTFIGIRADDSARFFDILIGIHKDGKFSRIYLAWDSAHKFGTRLVGDGLASYRDGIIYGESALAAAEFIDKKREEIYRSLPEFNRSKLLAQSMDEQYSFAKDTFGVSFQPM